MFSLSDYGVNSILFQRGIYPAETFVPVQQYGLTILMSKDDKIKDFLKNVLTQAEGERQLEKFIKFHSLPSSSYRMAGFEPDRKVLPYCY